MSQAVMMQLDVDTECDTPAVERFKASMALDFDGWFAGASYDLDAIAQANARERAAILELVLQQGIGHWREVQALAALGTPQALAELAYFGRCGNAQVRAAVARYAPTLIPI